MKLKTKRKLQEKIKKNQKMTKPKFERKNLNIPALEAGMRRRFGGGGCSCCRRHYANIINFPKLYRKKNSYISR